MNCTKLLYLPIHPNPNICFQFRMTEKQLDKVVVHPLVLLSVTDHFTRVGKTGRVVGILLGKWTMGGTELDISNSFALPFDEDNKDSDVWFLDHDYLESMFTVSTNIYHRQPGIRGTGRPRTRQ